MHRSTSFHEPYRLEPPPPLFRPAPAPAPQFDGPDVQPADVVRLAGQLAKVRDAMSDNAWWTIEQLQQKCGGSAAGISARIRDLRKLRFGGHDIERERVAGHDGLFRYRMRVKP